MMSSVIMVILQQMHAHRYKLRTAVRHPAVLGVIAALDKVHKHVIACTALYTIIVFV